MDSFEWNKVLGAILGSALFIFGVIRISADEIYQTAGLEEPAYKIEVQEETPGAGEEEEKAPADIGALLASADVDRGERVAKQCVSCHTFEKGGPAKTGPNLWNIVGRDKASVEGFAYSAAMKSQQGQWTFEELNIYLADPRKTVPGTNMAFAGVKRDSQRADLIAYLSKQNDNPPPYPEPAGNASTASAPPDSNTATP